MRRTGIAVSILFFCAVASTASAYVVLYKNNGEPRVWNASSIAWRFAAGGSSDVSNEEALTAIQEAFDSWENIECSTVSFSYEGLTNAYPNSGIYIAFEEESWDVTVADAAGVTTNWQFGQFGGGVTKVDIYLNGVDYTWSTSGADNPGSNLSDIQSVVAHEIGHAIGLDHSRTRSATMWFTAYPGQAEEQQTLDDDDKRAACFLYPSVTFNEGQACDACSQSSHCAAGACINFGSEGAFCGQNCSTTNGCPEGFGCYQLTGGGSPQCIPDNEHCAPVGGNIPLGDFCYDHATCQSGQCLVLPQSAVCTTSCNPQSSSSCPAGLECVGQGIDGVCYPLGEGNIGEPCVTATDCASFECLGIGNGQGICTESCTTDAQCGTGVLCALGYCIPSGDTGFGGACESPTECQGSICNFGKCSKECDTDIDCPGDGMCPAGVCTIGAQGQLGDVCGAGAEVCVAGLFCLVTEQGATQGTCQEGCDVRTDVCSAGKLCKWFYASWANKVSGYCVAPEGGALEGDACGGALTCEVGLVCADTDMQPLCLRDCNGSNLLGCSTGTKCKSLGLDDNPKLGACFPNDGGGSTVAGDASDITDASGGATVGTDGTTDVDESDSSGSVTGPDTTGGESSADASDGVGDVANSADGIDEPNYSESPDASGCVVQTERPAGTSTFGTHLFLLFSILSVCRLRTS